MMIGMLALPTYADKQKTSELPEMAFLEFLAEMQEIDGQLVAPTDLLDAQQKLNGTVKPSEKLAVDEQSQNDLSALLEFLNISDSQTESPLTIAEQAKSKPVEKEGNQ